MRTFKVQPVSMWPKRLLNLSISGACHHNRAAHDPHSEARRVGTQQLLKEQSVLDWRLLGRDVLSMLPYNEHPKNIALVLGLADGWAFQEIKPFGPLWNMSFQTSVVLKSYGPIHINGRSVSFTNGCPQMSAPDFYPTGLGPPFQRHQTQRTQSFKWSCTTTEQIGSLGKAFLPPLPLWIPRQT